MRLRMAEGTVLWYSAQLGYGFILHHAPEDVRETQKVFVHHTSIEGDEALEMGDKVTFSKISGEQGVEARNVVKTGSLKASTGGIPKEIRAGLFVLDSSV